MFVSWYDTNQIISKLTLNRIINALNVIVSYIISRWTKKPLIKGLPISIAIEPTTSCNLRCPECPSGLRSFTRPTGMLSDSDFERTIDQVAKHSIYLTFYFQGEPYLNPKFLQMVKYASEKRMYTATSTNAHYLDEEMAKKTVESGLDRLIISIDGTTQETYEQYRIGGNLDKVLDGTKNILEWKKKLKSRTPHVVWQFLVVRPNEHQIQELNEMAREYGVDKLGLKTAQVYDYEDGNDLIPTIDKYSRYRQTQEGKYLIKNKLLDHCWKMWSSCVITWDGQIIPCCFDKDAEHAIGSLAKNTFKDIWFSAPYDQFRTSVISSRSEVEMCKNCTEGTKIWA